MTRCRFAPSTTGPAHPGTLLAGLLCWLDARSRGAFVELRLEDLDPERSKPSFATSIQSALAWIGLDWDRVGLQSQNGEAHEYALDTLAAAGLLYPCTCTRSELRAFADLAPDGSRRYPNRCRSRSLPGRDEGGWRAARDPLRARLPEGRIELRDESGLDLSLDPARDLGDPIVRRRDGSVSYQLASVVDDHASGVTRIVRGRDLAIISPLQVVLGRALGYAEPVYRHHFLLLEERGEKLAKLHGAVGVDALRDHYSGKEMCAWLARAAGLRSTDNVVEARDLLRDFAWTRVRKEDRKVRWDGRRLNCDTE